MTLSTSRSLAKWERWVHYNDIHIESIIQLGFFVAVTARVQLLAQDEFNRHVLLSMYVTYMYTGLQEAITPCFVPPSPTLIAYM